MYNIYVYVRCHRYIVRVVHIFFAQVFAWPLMHVVVVLAWPNIHCVSASPHTHILFLSSPRLFYFPSSPLHPLPHPLSLSLLVGSGNGAVLCILPTWAGCSRLWGNIQPQVQGTYHGPARQEVCGRMCYILPQVKVSTSCMHNTYTCTCVIHVCCTSCPKGLQCNFTIWIPIIGVCGQWQWCYGSFLSSNTCRWSIMRMFEDEYTFLLTDLLFLKTTW